MSNNYTHHGATDQGSSSNHNGSSDLNFTSSSETNERDRPNAAQTNPAKSTFRWPSEPLNKGEPSLPQESQKTVDDANKEISDRISQADNEANTSNIRQPTHPGLEKPRLSAQLAATLDSLEDDRRKQLSPTANKPGSITTTPLVTVSPSSQSMHRTSSAGTSKSAGSAGSDKADTSSTGQYPNLMPEFVSNTIVMPLNLLRSLIPTHLLSDANQEGLSASTMQVPVTSVNALLEACKTLQWVAKRASSTEAADRTSGTRRNSISQQLSSEDATEFAHFDLFELVQKVADMVSGVAASRGIDLVINLAPKFVGRPAPNQRQHHLGSCTVWAEHSVIKFLLMNCLSKLVQSAPTNSTISLSSTLTDKDEDVLQPDSALKLKLMIFTLDLRLISHSPSAKNSDSTSIFSEPISNVLLDAFGAKLNVETGNEGEAGDPTASHFVNYAISLPVGKMNDSESSPGMNDETASEQQTYGPTPEQLSSFASTLKGKKVALYSSSTSHFAEQITGLLSGFGCNVAPVYSDAVDEYSFSGSENGFGKSTHTAVALTDGRPQLVSYNSDLDRQSHGTASPSPGPSSSDTAPSSTSQDADTAVLDPVTGVPVTFNNSLPADAPTVSPSLEAGSQDTVHAGRTGSDGEPSRNRIVPFSFVIIDDDIVTLQKELLRIRSAVPLLKSALGSKSASTTTSAESATVPVRPPLEHRTKSSPQIDRVIAQHPEAHHARSFGSLGNIMLNGTTAESTDESVSQTIIFFTSMKSYRLVRDTVQPIIDSASFRGVSSPPEIMVLPKPAGIRRILTALYSAEKKPIVNLPFLPIATSPLSPLTMHGKSWWAPESSQDQEGAGIMTLARRPTSSTDEDTDIDTAPPTPWSPVESGRPSQVPSPKIPLTSATLPLLNDANRPSQPRSHGMRSNRTQDTARDGAPGNTAGGSSIATAAGGGGLSGNTPLRGPASAPIGANAALAGDTADATSTQKSTHPSSAAQSTSSSSAALSRSHAVSTPMPADALEYFSETAAKMGGSAASGMVIQSPDGRPAGIFFQPKASSSSSSGASKPPMNRGVSSNSLRRSSTHASGEQGDGPGPSVVGSSTSESGRERRLTNRSNASSNHSMRSFSDLANTRHMPASSSSDQTAATGRVSNVVEGTTQQSQQSFQCSQNPATYPTGSMFAPQVGIHSVLNSGRPAVATPLSNASGQGSTIVTTARSTQPETAGNLLSSVPETAEDSQGSAKAKGPDGMESRVHEVGSTKVTTARLSKITTASDPNATGMKTDAKADAKSSIHSPTSPVEGRSGPPGPSASTVANRANPRQTFAGSTTNPSDTKTKPSAVPQAGFMIGMGFAPSARRRGGPKKAPVREAVLPPIKVLIVEDNPINQRILSTFMGRKKIKYDVANNGREAVDKWKTGGYHLILMDIQLPVMDGIQATKEIRKLERLSNIGILPNTPPATADSHAGEAGSDRAPPKKGGGSHAISAKGLVKYPVGGPLTSSSHTQSGNGGGGGNTGSGSKSLANGIVKGPRITVPTSGNGINPFRASVIIVALTASVLSSDRVEALAAGCNDFLNKPVSLPWLNQKILEWGSMMYLMYSGLASEDLSNGGNTKSIAGNNTGGGGGADQGTAAGRNASNQDSNSNSNSTHTTSNSHNKAQLHLGFGYGPAEKAKALASNLHLGDTLAAKKKKKIEEKEKLEKEKEKEKERLLQSPPQSSSVQPDGNGNGEGVGASEGEAQNRPPTDQIQARIAQAHANEETSQQSQEHQQPPPPPTPPVGPNKQDHPELQPQPSDKQANENQQD